MRQRIRLFIIILISLLCPSLAFGQDSGSAKIEKCSPGYAYDSILNECVACNQPCDTGQSGICGRGIVDCSGDKPVCRSAIEPGERMEICNGEDDDCDGKIDEGFDKDGDAYTTCGGDCDDRNAKIHPDAVERCDGEDNNCNGLVDDGFNVGAACTVGLGDCAREGKKRCLSSGLDAVCDAVPGESSIEICDGRDNDCNGEVDDGLGKISCGVGACSRSIAACVSGKISECVPGQPSAEICGDGVDNNCNGEVDEGFSELGNECFEGVGGCRRDGKKICSEDGLSLVCSAAPGDPAEEICGNGIDDNCNGIVDTDTPGLGEPCTNKLLGECLREGKRICDKETGKLICSATIVKPSKERCDNKDNDCDGNIDNDVRETTPCGKGRCEGGVSERICTGGNWREWGGCSTAGKAIGEICGNRVDDNCDGIVDDDAAGLGDPCDNGLLGACFRKGQLKCSGEDGSLVCSAGLVEPGDEICNGIDDDCDGEVDEGVTNACGGCGEVPGEPGEACHVPGGDECATGIWACREAPEGGMECALESKRSEGRICLPDESSCTLDICRNGNCSHPPEKDGLACDDSNPCTFDDVCISGICCGGAQVSCDDQNSCTTDACDPIHGCYHNAIGGGVANACGGCKILRVLPGESCTLESKTGACRQGRYMCQQDGSIACVQSVFERLEECNSVDDDCDSDTDEGFGTSTCGIGACNVTINNCDGGEMKACVPRDPLPETCGSVGTDDDCNGVVDDVAGLERDCPVAIGTCIIPGKMECVGDADFPVCVVSNPVDAEDEDGDGVVNYCDHGESIARGVEMDVGGRLSHTTGEAGSSSRLYDLSRTRAVMLPWQEIFDAVVIAPDSPDQAMILLSGVNSGGGGIAAIRAKNITADSSLIFQSCDAPEGMFPRRLLTVGDIADIIASTDRSYIRYPKIASQIPSAIAGNLSCMLRGELLIAGTSRSWGEKGRESACEVEEVVAIEKIASLPFMFAGAVKCVMPSGSMWKKDKLVLGVDVFTEQVGGTLSHEYVPFHVGTDDIEDVHVSFQDAPSGKSVFVTARIGDRRIVGACSMDEGGWRCWSDREDKNIDSVAYLGPLSSGKGTVGQFIISSDGRAFEVEFDNRKKKVKIARAGKVLTRDAGEDIGEVLELSGKGKRFSTILVASDELISTALVRKEKDGALHLLPSVDERFLPEAMADDVYVGGKLKLVHPHAMAILPLKNYGGRDLFVAFDINKGSKKMGEMGFFYWNANEWPSASLIDVSFDGTRGRAKFALEDSTGDPLTCRATIRAKHGGSLDNWIDGFRGGVLRFSVKGAAAVGVWPITMKIEASDPGGLVTISKIVLRRDGTVEALSESSGEED